MNDICLAACIEATFDEFLECQTGVGKQSEGESCHLVYFQSGRRFTPAAAF